MLQKAGGQYILGEKLRDKQDVHQEVLAKRGRYLKIRENMEIKEVIIGAGERRRRFILVHNPEEAKKDKATREKILARIEKSLTELGDQKGKPTRRACARLLPIGRWGNTSDSLRMEASRSTRARSGRRRIWMGSTSSPPATTP